MFKLRTDYLIDPLVKPRWPGDPGRALRSRPAGPADDSQLNSQELTGASASKLNVTLGVHGYRS